MLQVKTGNKQLHHHNEFKHTSIKNKKQPQTEYVTWTM